MDRHYGRACAFPTPSSRRETDDAGWIDRHKLTEGTREMVKNSTDDVKNLAAFPAGGPHVRLALQPDSRSQKLKSWTTQSSRKPVQSKLSREFTTALTAFQRVQRLSAERQRTSVETQKRKVDQLVEGEGP